MHRLPAQRKRLPFHRRLRSHQNAVAKRNMNSDRNRILHSASRQIFDARLIFSRASASRLASTAEIIFLKEIKAAPTRSRHANQGHDSSSTIEPDPALGKNNRAVNSKTVSRISLFAKRFSVAAEHLTYANAFQAQWHDLASPFRFCIPVRSSGLEAAFAPRAHLEFEI